VPGAALMSWTVSPAATLCTTFCPTLEYAVRLYAGTVAGRGVPTISTGRTAASGTCD
jgi:hypothetical protein